MSSSAISICSNALQQLGDDPIASFAASEGKRARLCSNLWPQARDALLRAHVWPCIRRRVILAPTVEPPEFDWDYQFLLPPDWLRTIQVGKRGERLNYEMAGQHIMADTNALHLVYCWRSEDPALWDSLLADLACTLMTAKLAYPITKSTSLASEKMDEFRAALRTAKSIAGQDNEPEEWGDSPFTDVRF